MVTCRDNFCFLVIPTFSMGFWVYFDNGHWAEYPDEETYQQDQVVGYEKYHKRSGKSELVASLETKLAPPKHGYACEIQHASLNKFVADTFSFEKDQVMSVSQMETAYLQYCFMNCLLVQQDWIKRLSLGMCKNMVLDVSQEKIHVLKQPVIGNKKP